MAESDELRECPKCEREIHVGAWRCCHCGFHVWVWYDHPPERRPELEQ